jgi:putative flippase GtrA
VIAGGTNTLLGVVAYVLLLPLIHYTTAYTVTYIGGIPVSYYLNSRFVFRQPLHWKKAFQFPLVYVVQYVGGIVLLFLLVEVLHLDKVIANLLSIAFIVPLTFILSRVIIKGRAASSQAI